jgi:hypothetical protein
MSQRKRGRHFTRSAAAIGLFAGAIDIATRSNQAAAASLPVAHWLAPVSGQWVDGSKWSSAPGVPTQDVYEAAIDATGTPYTVTVGQFDVATAARLTLSSDATLHVMNRLDVAYVDGRATTVDGAGTIVLTDADFHNGNSQLTIGAGVTIRGGGTSVIATNNGFINQGTVVADGPGRIFVSGNRWKNQGLVKAVNGGTFDLSGTVEVGGLGAFDSTGGTVKLRGTLLNTGNNLVLDGPGNVLTLAGTISGGSVTTSNGAALRMEPSWSMGLKDILLDSDVQLVENSRLTIVGATTLAPGRKIIATAGGGAAVDFASTFAGEIVAAGGSLQQSGSQSFVYGPGIIVRAAGGDVTIGGNGPTYNRTNNGRLASEVAGKSFLVYGSATTFTNNGTIAVSGGTFLITVQKFLHNGTIDVSGAGTFVTDSTNYANKGIPFNGPNAALNLSGGGTVVAAFVDTLAHPAGFTWTGGTLRITGSGSNFAGTLTVPSGGTLAGGGTITDPVTVSPGGTVAPGASPAILSTGSISFAASATLAAEVNGTTAGPEYDQLNVTGTVVLDDALLDLSFGYAPLLNDAFTLIKNDGTDPITGTFLALDEGATFTETDSLSRVNTLRISYVGGDGNDVVVQAIAVPEPAGVAAGVGLGVLGTTSRRRRR